jgi:hypothetical protein
MEESLARSRIALLRYVPEETSYLEIILHSVSLSSLTSLLNLERDANSTNMLGSEI